MSEMIDLSIHYKGSVWTCDTHHVEIVRHLIKGDKASASAVLRKVHPKKLKLCRECLRLYTETPPSNR